MVIIPSTDVKSKPRLRSSPLFSSLKQDWKTPIDLFLTLTKEFNFDFDPCPSNPSFDGLKIDWGKNNFVNPPYNQIASWVKKAYEEHQKDKIVVLLIPSRTDTKWWHRYILKADEIRFIQGRLKFQGAKYTAPFPSCVVIFKK